MTRKRDVQIMSWKGAYLLESLSLEGWQKRLAKEAGKRGWQRRLAKEAGKGGWLIYKIMRTNRGRKFTTDLKNAVNRVGIHSGVYDTAT